MGRGAEPVVEPAVNPVMAATGRVADMRPARMAAMAGMGPAGPTVPAAGGLGALGRDAHQQGRPKDGGG
jgi:hypothetical protein